MIKRIYVSFMGLGLIILAGSVLAEAGAARADKTKVGQVAVHLVAPAGLDRVDGTEPTADAYLKKIEPKLKIKVLAIYAVTSEWKKFVQAIKNGQPVAIPRLALICVPQKMPKKSFDLKKLLREHRKFSEWFSLAANNRPMTLLLSSHGNKKLEEILGVNLDFNVKHDKYTQKFASGSSFMSIGTGVSFNIFGQTSTIYLTATSQAVGDKMIFLGYVEAMDSSKVVESIQTQALSWRKSFLDAQATSQ